ncbi:hypothetical protein [Arthrobacter sp. W4I7]|uniref:hypothetical protein n=1 Tax=Arthrobacter sp. W4I7 TaxID=3042296 RepID=UPI002782441B|nr:hypothetical protein [Arthrobacter sp. W4I7]MDQ0693077.1 hypothetical protein [Arthrobacter sp. W4I7]
MPAHVFADFFNLSVELGSEIKKASGTYADGIQVLDHDTVKKLSTRIYEIGQDMVDDPASGTSSRRTT